MSSLVEIYDTTPRDGAQGGGANFSAGDESRAAEHLVALAHVRRGRTHPGW